MSSELKMCFCNQACFTPHTVVVKQQINDKIKHRLQQLDDFEENVSEHKGLSRDDYVTRITQISQELHLAWSLDQRVKALKIVIQVKYCDGFFNGKNLTQFMLTFCLYFCSAPNCFWRHIRLLFIRVNSL